MFSKKIYNIACNGKEEQHRVAPYELSGNIILEQLVNVRDIQFEKQIRENVQ